MFTSPVTANRVQSARKRPVSFEPGTSTTSRSFFLRPTRFMFQTLELRRLLPFVGAETSSGG